MPRIFTLITESRSFLKKQPVLYAVTLWLLFVPIFSSHELTRYLSYLHKSAPTKVTESIVTSLASLVSIVLLFWGITSVLTIGKRLLAAKAGRSRTSLSAVCKESKALIIPLLLTSILRSIITLLWAILFIVPGLIYGLRTSLVSVVIAEEGIAYNEALKKSINLVRGHTWEFCRKILGLVLMLFAPISILSAILRAANNSLPWMIIVDAIASLLLAFSLTILLLSLIQMYDYLRPQKGPIMGGGRK